MIQSVEPALGTVVGLSATETLRMTSKEIKVREATILLVKPKEKDSDIIRSYQTSNLVQCLKDTRKERNSS